MLAPPLRIHSWSVKWSPGTVAVIESGTTATWVEPLKENTRDESEEGRVGSAAVQFAAGDGGGSRSTSPLTAPEQKHVFQVIEKKDQEEKETFLK